MTRKCIELAPSWGKGWMDTYGKGAQRRKGRCSFQSLPLRTPRPSTRTRTISDWHGRSRTSTPCSAGCSWCRSKGPPTQRGDKFDELVQRILAEKASLPALYLKYHSNPRPARLCDVTSDEVVLEVLLSHITTSEEIDEGQRRQSSDGSRQLLSSRVGEHRRSHTLVACFLLLERSNPYSFWKQTVH